VNKRSYWLSTEFKQSALQATQPKNDWVLPAGKNNQLLKKPSIPVNYVGSAVQYRPDPLLDAAANKKRENDVKRYVVRNDTVLKEALEILSQSNTGRYLLEQITKEGYKIAYDDRRTAAYGAGGLCDPENKMIILRSGDDPHYIALVIGHEAVHALQNSHENMFPNSSHKPEAGIRLSFAIEADAYAQQTQMALELMHGDPDGPDNQVTYKEPLQQMKNRFPNIVKAAERAMLKRGAFKSGAVAAAAFEGFYDNPRLRTFYEDAHVAWSGEYAPHLMQDPAAKNRHFCKDVDSKWIKDKIRYNGKAYLNEHTPNLDFMDERHSGLTTQTQEKILGFYKKWRPEDPLPVLKTFGVHMKDAVSWVLGVVSDNGAVIVKDKNNKQDPKPGIRPPPPKQKFF